MLARVRETSVELLAPYPGARYHGARDATLGSPRLSNLQHQPIKAGLIVVLS